jgi:hypothetical protein
MGSLSAVHSPQYAQTITTEGELAVVPMMAIAWLTDRNEIAIAVAANQEEIRQRMRCIYE